MSSKDQYVLLKDDGTEQGFALLAFALNAAMKYMDGDSAITDYSSKQVYKFERGRLVARIKPS